jgi:hypothetical protein
LEYTAFWTTVFAYAVATALALGGLIFNRERWLTAAGVVCGAGLLAHLVAVGARIAYTDHLPVAGRYENVLTGAAVVVLFSLVTVLRRRGLAPMLVFVAPFALLMLGYALLEQPSYTTMSLVLDNLWMFVHIFFAWLAYGAYSVAAALGVVYLLRSREAPRDLPPLLQRLPEPPVLRPRRDDHDGGHLGSGSLGELLELGSRGDLEPPLGAALRTVDPPAGGAALAGPADGVARRRRSADRAVRLLGHQPVRRDESLARRPPTQGAG